MSVSFLCFPLLLFFFKNNCGDFVVCYIFLVFFVVAIVVGVGGGFCSRVGTSVHTSIVNKGKNQQCSGCYKGQYNSPSRRTPYCFSVKAKDNHNFLQCYKPKSPP